MESHADIATSLLARAPSLAATSVRGGVLALLVKLRQRPRTASERESVHRIVASLGKLEGAAMKLGQHMSYFDPTWPEDGLDRSGASCEASRWHARAGELAA